MSSRTACRFESVLSGAARTVCTIRFASQSPAAHPHTETMRLSASEARRICPKLPPSARRTANSRSREAARPTSRPETFAHAINRTSAAPAANGTTVSRASCRDRS